MRDDLSLHRAWIMKAGGMRWLHDQAHRHYKKINNRFCYASIVLSTISGVGGFGTQSIQTPQTASIVLYCIATLNIANGLLTSFQKFVCAAEKSEVHGNVARQYATFVRHHTVLQHMFTTDVSSDVGLRDKRLREVLTELRSEYERLHAIGPDVPHKIVRLFKQTFQNYEHPPEIANGLTDLDHDKRPVGAPSRTSLSTLWKPTKWEPENASTLGETHPL